MMNEALDHIEPGTRLMNETTDATDEYRDTGE
jgi:hypothetical protein